MPEETRKQLLEIGQREDIPPHIQLASLDTGEHDLRRLEREWKFVADSFCVDPFKMRLNDPVHLLARFDPLGGDASLELDVRLGRKEPLPESCTVKDLILMLGALQESGKDLA